MGGGGVPDSVWLVGTGYGGIGGCEVGVMVGLFKENQVLIEESE